MLQKLGIDRVFDAEKIVVTPDHFQPAKDIASAQLHKRLDAWAKEKGIKHYYPIGRAGVCHALLPEQGHVRPANSSSVAIRTLAPMGRWPPSARASARPILRPPSPPAGFG